MLHAGLDLSRRRLDFHLLDESGETVELGAAPPDADGLRSLAERVGPHGQPRRAAIESMNGARFVHDQLELYGWQVEIADAQRVRGLAPLACKTDRIDARVLAELSRLELVPTIWLPTERVRAERERARFRLHLVRHRSSLKQRVHAILLAHGRPCPVADLFGLSGRALLARLELPEPWSAHVEASLRLVDELDAEIDACERELRRLGREHEYVPLLLSARASPGCSPPPSPPRSATSPALPRRRSWSATAASAHASTSPASTTAAGGSPSTVPSTCAGPWSRRPRTPAGIRPTPSATSTPSAGSANSAAPRSPRSTSPGGWQRRSGTCSPASNPSPRQAPQPPWLPDSPVGIAPPERTSHPPCPPVEQAIEK